MFQEIIFSMFREASSLARGGGMFNGDGLTADAGARRLSCDRIVAHCESC